MKIYLKTLLLVALVTAASFIVASTSLLKTDIEVLEVFFSVFGAIYAIVAGFVVLVVLNNYGEIKQHISAEINALQDIRDYLVYVDDKDQEVKVVRDKIKIYTQSVIGKEWPNMISISKTNMDTSEELYNIMKSINAIKPDNQSDIVALEKLIDTVGEITTHRTNRLSTSTEKLPPLLQHILLILSVSIVLTFTLMPISQVEIRILLNSVIAIAVTLIYFMIMDLNNPFKGNWKITDEQFQDLLKTME